MFPYFAVFISFWVSWSTYCFEYSASIVHTYIYPVTLHHILEEQNLNLICNCEGNSRLFNGTFAM